jgi:hypothetical protein
MTDDYPLPPEQHLGAAGSDPFADQWSGLEPDEQRLVTMAVEAIAAGVFDSSHSWQRFTDSAIELLPALDANVLSVAELHQRALAASCIDGSASGTTANGPAD